MSEQSPAPKNKTNMWARRKARRALTQAAYQWQVNETAVLQLRREFGEQALDKADADFFADVLALMVRHVGELDAQLAPLLDRSGEQLDVVERGILRLAATELNYRIDVPYSVVINEYVELTKTFGAQDAYKYVNGVLDRLAQDVRSIEVAAHQGN
ncbi:MAG TPA: transcription antitermination factor NusB [Gammaproteobacteria bacterium]|jgi:N utilization substance protein B|nr:transcription antitermination factor NusB [Gammaproteobacteria bacterium]HCG69245.1 transcription antitermination factor NusB [Gammaproteobacteria bacterium]